MHLAIPQTEPIISSSRWFKFLGKMQVNLKFILKAEVWIY